MILDIKTLAFISSLTFIIQSIALLIQFIINRSYRGIVWWLIGSCLCALGVSFMPLVTNQSLLILAMLANPLVIIGQSLIYVGIQIFLNQKPNKWFLASCIFVILFLYYFFIFFDNDISARTIIVTAAIGLFSFLTGYKLFDTSDRKISGSARFTGSIFLAYGLFMAVRNGIIWSSPPVQQYSDQGLTLVISFVVPIVASMLWTFGLIIMVSQRLNAEIQEEKEKLLLIFNASPDAVLISRLSDGLILDVNTGFLGMSGYSRDELIGNSTLSINIWQNPEDRFDFSSELKEKGICENKEFVFRRKDGSFLNGRVTAKIIVIQAVNHIISVVHDITQSKLAEEAVRESEELYRSILNASPDDITITDMLGRILVISPAAKAMFGYEQEYNDFVGTQLLDYIVPEDRARARSNIMIMCKGEYTGPNEYRAIRKDGSLFDIEVNSGLIHKANQSPAKMVFIVRNITERKQTEQRIQHLVQQLEIEKKAAQHNAITDSLTGLANRRYFDEALNLDFHRMKRSKSPLSLIMLDVDHFKKFNDHYGHVDGDDCLRKIGMVLTSLVGRVTDTVARYGGEEFVVILPDTEENGAASLAERIRLKVEELAIPHAASEVAKVLTITLGVVTVYSTDLSSPEQIISLADDALYRAKNEGRNRISILIEKSNMDVIHIT